MSKLPTVDITASRQHGVLYVGVTSDLVRRVWQHRADAIDGFTKDYRVHALVYFETHREMAAAITREKQLKKWNRDWKVRLIEETSPDWLDLWPTIAPGDEGRFPPSRE
jgi:putative endonuclease